MEESAAAPRPRRPGTAKALAGIHVLLVDDDADWCDVVRLALENCGAMVTNVHDAISALQVIDFARPDVVLVDLRMPAPGGRWLAVKLRERWLRRGQRTPAIAVTSYLHDFGARSLRAAFDAIFEKPLDLRALSTTIAQVLGKTGQAGDVGAADR